MLLPRAAPLQYRLRRHHYHRFRRCGHRAVSAYRSHSCADTVSGPVWILIRFHHRSTPVVCRRAGREPTVASVQA
jgi:hypothetical protein